VLSCGSYTVFIIVRTCWWNVSAFEWRWRGQLRQRSAWFSGRQHRSVYNSLLPTYSPTLRMILVYVLYCTCYTV